MNTQLAMETLGDLHGVSHEPGPDLLRSAHPRGGGGQSNHLAHGARPLGMAALLDGGDYAHHRSGAEHPLGGPLHPTITMACETPPGLSMSSTYTTLTPLQPLPPISTVADKFPHHHHHPHHPHHPSQHPHHPHQRLSGNVSGSFTLMRDERSLAASMNNLYSPYHAKDVPGMGQRLSPLSGSGLGGLHGSQQGLPHYAHPGAAAAAEKMLAPNGYEAHHPALLARHGEQHLTPTSAPGMGPLHGIPHHPHAHLSAPGHGQILGAGPREAHPGAAAAGAAAAASGQVNGGGSGSGQMEEINTKEVAQRITTELKRYSIPQAIFAQRVLCRSQGTLSDLLRNPKPWSKLKSGRETFRRMWKWLQEPEFQRMSALRLAANTVIANGLPTKFSRSQSQELPSWHLRGRGGSGERLAWEGVSSASLTPQVSVTQERRWAQLALSLQGLSAVWMERETRRAVRLNSLVKGWPGAVVEERAGPAQVAPVRFRAAAPGRAEEVSGFWRRWLLALEDSSCFPPGSACCLQPGKSFQQPAELRLAK
uniref:One cut homeobox 1 n=1 Tax=Podarcis muralis TaxID=64176 RepID=A0A670KGF9_PODMU